MAKRDQGFISLYGCSPRLSNRMAGAFLSGLQSRRVIWAKKNACFHERITRRLNVFIIT